jgi:beta-lactamase regulating signal transducer with metallopeptidase domain/protein involved in polysaccharide export with SLBB domain
MKMSWLQQAWLETLGWTLVHSLWELSLLAAVAAIALLMLRRQSAPLRYVVGYALLMGMMAVPVGTYAYFWARRVRVVPAPEAVASVMIDAPIFIGEPVEAMPHVDAAPVDVWQRVMGWLRTLPPYAAMGYLIGAALLTLRLLAGYGALRRVRTAAFAATQHEALLDELRQRLRVPIPVRLMQSARVEVPTVIGAWRPIILLPVSAMTGLSAEHLTYLLLHELAHIRRHDYLANLTQSIVETLLFYHPAMVWLSAQVRQEREHCCDDLAVAAAGNRGGYAAALASMESLRAEPANVPGGLTLGARGGSLLQRVHRILQVPMPRSIGQRIVSGASIAAAAGLVLAFAAYLAACSRNDAPPAASQAANKNLPVDSENMLLTTQPAVESLNRPAQVGDVLEVTVYELIAPGKYYTDHVPVDENGNIRILAIGNVPATGKTPRQLEDAIAKAAVDGQLMHNAEVRVAFTDEHTDLRPLRNGERVSFKIFELEGPGEFLTDTAVVDENGELPVWHVGRIHVTGLTPAQAAAKIASTTVEKSILRNPAYVQVFRAAPDPARTPLPT